MRHCSGARVSIVQPNNAKLSIDLSGLFSGDARVAELYGQGDPAQLLPAEAAFLGRAVAKRAQEFAAGRVCARRALAEFGIHDVPIEMAADRQPRWPQSMVGSITHTAGYCAAVVATRDTIAAIGLDSEASAGVHRQLWPSICLAAEIDWLNSLPEQQQHAAATLIFSAKEAFYKCQYPLTLERLGFHDARVELIDWGGRRGAFSITATRHIGFAACAALPMMGRYTFHRGFVTTGLCTSP